MIVVGNITVGGTGKTPMVIWLANRLTKSGWHVGIVSRGYRDEALLLEQKTNCPISTNKNRVKAVKELIGQCNIIISDDGLQHYALPRDIEIIMVDKELGLGNKQCLPAGPLREPPSRLKEADYVCSLQQIPLHITNIATGKVKDFRGHTVHAAAGIAHPHKFFNSLRALGMQVIEHPFPDHYLYQPADLEFSSPYPIIMTEKDAVKCRAFSVPNLWVLMVEVTIAIERRSPTMDSRLLGILVCPLCKGSLVYKKTEQELVCKFDKLAYPIRDEIPVMLDQEARKVSLEEIEKL